MGATWRKRFIPLYTSGVCLGGLIIFFYSFSFDQGRFFFTMLLAIGVILLNYYDIKLPPNGNGTSFDSSLHLAVLVVFGMKYVLFSLLLSTIFIFIFQYKKMVWWKHIFNFSMYVLMISSAYCAFLFFGGKMGAFNFAYALAYIASFVAYYTVNAFVMTFYFFLNSSQRMHVIVTNIVKETFFEYMIILGGAVILTLSLPFYPMFALTMFTSILVVLSIIFRKYSYLYEEVLKDKVFIEQLLNALPSGIIMNDKLKGSYFINESATTLLSLEKKDIEHMLNERQKPKKNKAFWELLLANAPVTNKKIVYKTLETKTFLISKVELKNRYDERIGEITYFLDITEIEELTKRMHQSEKLALMGEMAAKAAHEIRNPLAVIHGFLAFMNENLHERDREQYHIPLLLKEIDRINAIVEDMLLIAKPSAPVMKEAYMETIVQDVLSLFQQTLEAKNIRVHVRLDHVPLQLDSKQMMQVLYNLLHNSIEAMGEGGTICIYSDVDETYNMYMYDSGSGIPTHMQEMIFEPFITTKSSGTGLGLTIVKRIIENHGGTIALHDSSEKGTTFVIRLPIGR
ncbi:two-component system sensor histidine kinase NtrB [Anoxybacillus flavithermus]|uniref:two-component system sensor histidine kinase NtrB n=1 Tax=Anoxybacillus flavithermus TaxID=33934 RepID=UPI0003A0856E|nr:ATP-binding protein [Anoxybacillus flavithermus]